MEPIDAITDQLAETAASIDVGDSAAVLAEVHATTGRRRRRRQVLVGACASVALIAGGVVAVSVVGNSDPGSLSIQGAPDTDVPTTDVGDAAGAAAPGESADEPPATAAPAQTRTVSVVDGSTRVVEFDGPAGGGDENFVEWVVPWRDGFLAGRRSFTPQALPELSDDIIALFPPEVVDFFNGELPPTINEATQMLSEAGLLDEVTAVLAEHPEASDAIYSVPVDEPSFEVFFTTDGSDWEPVPFEPPVDLGTIQFVQATGDRLVVMTQKDTAPPTSLSNQFAEPDNTGSIVIASTTDLATWEIAEVPVDQRPADLPEVLSYGVHPQGLAVNENGWVLSSYTFTNVRFDKVIPLLPEDVQATVNGGNAGYGYGFTEAGIEVSIDEQAFDVIDGVPVTTLVGEQPVETVSTDGATAGPSAVYTVTWDELGVAPGDVDGMIDQGPGLEVRAAQWGEVPVAAKGVEDMYSIVAAVDGFYSVSGTLRFSPDGVTWSDLEAPDDSWGVNSVFPIDRGVIAFVGSETGTEIYRVDGAAGTWELLDVPGLPESLSNSYGNTASVSALLLDSTPQMEMEPFTIVVESDGYTLTTVESFPTTSVTLTDSSGAVLIDESWNRNTDDDPGVVEWSTSGVDLIDVATGEVIVSIDAATMDAAYQAQIPEANMTEQPSPDLWLVASTDGERWLVDDLADSDGFYGQGAVAINGTTMLVNVGPDWTRYDLS